VGVCEVWMSSMWVGTIWRICSLHNLSCVHFGVCKSASKLDVHILGMWIYGEGVNFLKIPKVVPMKLVIREDRMLI
jgi:hypothetical protein